MICSCDDSCNVVPGYVCYGGDQLHPDSCSEPCGTGLNLTGTKQCDDGNLTPGDGCSPTCTIEDGFQCPVFNASCTEVCGDGYNMGLNECDDGNRVSGDGCDANCTIEKPGWTCGGGNFAWRDICYEICGDGRAFHSKGVNCDDGNNYNGDGCSSKCQIERGY